MKKLLLALAIIFAFANYNVSAAAENKKSIEINVAARMLYLYDDGKLVKKYPVCVGKPSTPTPLGEYRVIYKAVDPYWIHEGKVVSPGPENPLGIRWIGILEDIGIHGNAKPESIGTFASGGCIRMYNKDVEELYSIAPVNTPVSIKYDRMEIFEDKYSYSKSAIVYPDAYNRKDSRLYMEKLKAEGFDGAFISRAEKLLARKSGKASAVSSGIGVFLNNQYVTCDAINKGESIFLNSQAASEVLGLSSDMVNKLELPVYENNGKVYVELNSAVKKLSGKLEYDKAVSNVYISLKLLKVNGVYLTGSISNFDREYYMDVASLKKLGYDMNEDKVEINIFGKSIIKIMRNNKASIALDSLLKVSNSTKSVNSAMGIIDLRMPTIVRYNDMVFVTTAIGDRLCIQKEAADRIIGGEDLSASTFSHMNVNYIETAKLLEGHSYKTNEYFTVIDMGKSEL